MKSQGLKRALALKIAQATGVRFVDTLAVMERFMDDITQLLAAGKDVELRNFGVFCVRTRKGRTCATGLTAGKRVTTPARRFVRFKMGRLLRAAVTDGEKVTLLGVKRCKRSEKQPS